jgi:Skp family chaperone for outer membrane proteins
VLRGASLTRGSEASNGIGASSGNDQSPAQQRSATPVKKMILTATGFICLAGGTYFLTDAFGQDKPSRPAAGAAKNAAPAEDDQPHRIGVVDIDYIFEKYEKVKVEMEEIKAEIQATEEKLKDMQKKGQEQFVEYKEMKEGTPEKKAKEEKLTQLQALFDAKRKSFQNELKREQAKLQLTIYQEIQDAVKVVANHNNITLVVKISRNDPGSTSDPARTQAMMGQPCIFHRKQDDMTETVLNLMNKKYLRENPEAANRVTPAGNEEPVIKKPKSGGTAGGGGKVKNADGKKAAD